MVTLRRGGPKHPSDVKFLKGLLRDRNVKKASGKHVFPHLTRTGGFGRSVEIRVKWFQKKNHLKADGIVGSRTWDALENKAGVRGKVLARKLYDECVKVSNQGRSYRYGGGHGLAFSHYTSRMPLDCSSATGYGLRLAGLFPQPEPVVSGTMAHMWEHGKGRYVTIWANSYHVWIQFHGLGRFWRFDTSPWGSGSLGPRMRVGSRPTRGFTPRHPKGL